MAHMAWTSTGGPEEHVERYRLAPDDKLQVTMETPDGLWSLCSGCGTWVLVEPDEPHVCARRA